MRLGIIGLPVAGKTTVFNALTGAKHPVGVPSGAARSEVGHGVAEVPDDRLAALSAIYHPRKTTPLRIELGDISGLSGRGEVSGELANELGKWDGLLLVLRGFDSPLAASPPDPQRDLGLIESEFILSDLVRVEGRLERLSDERQKGGRDRAEVDRELALFGRLAESLGNQQPLRLAELSAGERSDLQGYGLLTTRPVLAVQNLSETDAPQPLETPLPNQAYYAKLEAELAELPEDEAQAFREEFGMQRSGTDQLLQAALAMMNQITFFTAGEPEVRAWPLARSGSALEAAGTIHSDMARGFIRAEVIQWDRLVELGGYQGARQAGQLKIEGRENPILDGDVVLVRFNV